MSIILCSCISYGCHKKTCEDDKGRKVRGNFVFMKEYAKHSQADRCTSARANDTKTDHIPETTIEVKSIERFERPQDDGSSNRHTDIRHCLDHMEKELGRRSIESLRGYSLRFVSRKVQGSPMSLHLEQSSPANASFLSFRRWLNETLQILHDLCADDFNDLTRWKQELIEALRIEQRKLQNTLEKEAKGWQHRVTDDSLNNYVNTEHHFLHSVFRFDKTTLVAHVMAAAMHLLGHVSEDHCRVLLQTFNFFIASQGSDPQPMDIRTVISHLDLDPKYREYFPCPSCNFLYPKDSDIPGKCTFRETNDLPPCGHELGEVKQIRGNISLSFARAYLHSSLKEWMGWMLCRPGMEELLDRDVFANGSPEFRRDVWDGDVLRNFPGPDGMPFVKPSNEREGTDGRYVFAFSWDGMNPIGNKEAGKKISSCPIYLMCLNLPVELRQLTENLFLVGVIPGPSEPSMQQLNHYLAPLIDELLEFWNHGIQYSRTQLYPSGRKVRIALLLTVADMLATRQVTGNAYHSSRHLCTFCWQTKDQINDTEHNKWTMKTDADHRAHATAWHNAMTQTKRKKLYEQHGIRYTELVRLPYWKGITSVGIDSMHLFYLGLLKRHCRGVWGFDAGCSDGDGTQNVKKIGPMPQRDMLQKAFEHLKNSDFKKLLGGTTTLTLYYLCKEFACLPAERFWKRKKELVKKLKEYSQNHSLPEKLPKMSYAKPIPAPEELRIAYEYMQKSDSSNLSQCETSTLRYLCEVFRCELKHRNPKRNTMANELLSFVKYYHCPDTLPQRGNEQQWIPRERSSGAPPEDDSFDENQLKQARAAFYEGLTLNKFVKAVISKLYEEIVSKDTVDEWEAISRRTKKEMIEELKKVQGKKITHKEIKYAIDLYNSGRSLEDLPKAALAAILATKRKDTVAVPLKTKDDLLHELTSSKEYMEAKANFANAPLSNPKSDSGISKMKGRKKTKIKVIGYGRLSEIWHDMEAVKQERPTWLTPVPKQMGTSKAGKLTADQWWTACFVHLTVTLIRLWGPKPEGSRWSKMLANFMDGLSAIKLGMMRTTNAQLAEDYTLLMKRYLIDLLILYPQYSLVPNHHLAMHFGEHLNRFGPAHTSRAFVFERENLRLQNVQTNAKTGQMERTMFIQYCRAQKLRAIMKDGETGKLLKANIPAMSSLCETKSRGSLAREIVEVEIPRQKKTSGTLSPQLHEKLQELCEERNLPRPRVSDITWYSSVFHNGVDYHSTKSLRIQDSHVVIGTSVRDQKWRAADIEDVLRFSYHSEKGLIQQHFLIINWYQELSDEDSDLDNYRKFPIVGGRIYYEKFEASLDVVPVDLLISHFVKTQNVSNEIRPKHFHALPLDK